MLNNVAARVEIKNFFSLFIAIGLYEENLNHKYKNHYSGRMYVCLDLHAPFGLVNILLFQRLWIFSKCQSFVAPLIISKRL
jgi:hypothetical protein